MKRSTANSHIVDVTDAPREVKCAAVALQERRRVLLVELQENGSVPVKRGPSAISNLI